MTDHSGYKAKCSACEKPQQQSDDDWTSVWRRKRSHAKIIAATHDRRNHGGNETATVVEVEWTGDGDE